ncbi:galectin-3-like isoform X1 [Ixodes scapularis]|uniref:galectin-3-like isoform X1 n=1 Tax=Ixodes scapularis TaxID=6945 RepID=UPI001A9F13BC|nr:galectin-3-like isoform X1 [Ixodes scapularis]
MNRGSLIYLFTFLLLAVLANGQFYADDDGIPGFPGLFPGKGGDLFPDRNPTGGLPDRLPTGGLFPDRRPAEGLPDQLPTGGVFPDRRPAGGLPGRLPAGGVFPDRRPAGGLPGAYPGGPDRYPEGSPGRFPGGLPGGTSPTTCRNHICPIGTRCVSARIQCVRAPCEPITTCVS